MEGTAGGSAAPEPSVGTGGTPSPRIVQTMRLRRTFRNRPRGRYSPRMKRVIASSAEVRHALERIRSLRGDQAALREFALEVLPGEGNPELLSVALRALAPAVRPEDHEVLRDLYDYFGADGKRQDPGGAVRIEILGALWHLRNAYDRGLAEQAASTVEVTAQGDGAMLRAAGLALLGMLDPEAANLRAVEILGQNDAEPMNGEPAATAARLLVANGETVALALYAHAFEESAPPEVMAECLRGMTAVPAERIEGLLRDVSMSRSDVVMLGFSDFLLGHQPEDLVSEFARRVFRSAGLEVYGYFAAAVVASRRDDLMSVFLETLETETSQAKRKVARAALELAAPSAAVEVARVGLGVGSRK
jgi:hypothetical protein